MHNPAILLVSVVVLVCGYTAFSFFQRAYEAGAAKAKTTTKVIVKAVRLRYNLIMGAILAIFAISGLVWIVQNW
jgi:amino acid permease